MNFRRKIMQNSVTKKYISFCSAAIPKLVPKSGLKIGCDIQSWAIINWLTMMSNVKEAFYMVQVMHAVWSQKACLGILLLLMDNTSGGWNQMKVDSFIMLE